MASLSTALSGLAVPGKTSKPKARPKTQNIDLGTKGSFKIHKGALHRALGVPEGKKIPASKMAGHHTGHVGHMIASAKGFAAMRKR